jgi:septum formation protein
MLRAAGLEAVVIISGVDESSVDASEPALLCRTLARMKAQAVAAKVASGLVLGCDSVLDFDGRILGKPTDREDAISRWVAMRGRSGVLHTGHCLIDAATGRSSEEVATTTVYFADITDAEIEAYVATGEPFEVAGAFTIDGRGGPFVERIDGDPGTVVGLSLPLLRRLMRDLGIRLTDLWR